MQANEYRTLITFVKEFRSFIQAHEQIETLFLGFDDEIDLEALDPQQLPFVFLGLGDATFDQGSTSVSFEIVIADIYLSQSQEGPIDAKGYEAMTAQQNLLYLMNDIFSWMKNGIYTTSGATAFNLQNTLELPLTLQPFNAKYKDHLIGWMGTFSLEINDQHDLCLAPVS